MDLVPIKNKLETDLLELKKQLDAFKKNEIVLSDVFDKSSLPCLITHDIKKNVGELEHLGDVFVGIKNTSAFSLDITISMGEWIKEKITIAPGEIAQAFEGYPIPQFYKERKIYYEIKKTNPNDFFYSVFFNTEPIRAQFIYGVVTEDVRTVFQNGCIFINYIKEDEEKLLLFYHNTISDWLYIACSLYPDYINDSFVLKYLQDEYNHSDILSKFKEMNPHWIQISTRLV